MEARPFRCVVAAIAVLFCSMGARHRGPNFIIETADPRLAVQFSEAAERLRHDLAVEWTGEAMPNWAQPCVMTVNVGNNLGAGGATTFVFDRGEVYGWRMSIQGSAERVIDSVLPHEITHMIFATHLRAPVPRWADEGGATSVEHATELMKHRRMLVQFLQTGRGIAFNRLFAMKEYPTDVMPLYAQGYSVADYLIQTGGRRRFLAFVAAAMEDDNWSAAAQKHYGNADLGALQTTWLAWVQKGSPTLQRADDRPNRPDHPAAIDNRELLTDARRPRPEPNVLLRVRNNGLAARPAEGDIVRGELVPVRYDTPAASMPAVESLAGSAIPAGKPQGGIIRGDTARPQPPSQPGQIILQWSKP